MTIPGEAMRTVQARSAAGEAPAASTLQEICTRVNDALRRKGQTPDALFDALAAGGQEVRWPDFRALFAQLEPSLGEGQLQQLWITFDTNADGGISREEFRTQLAKLQALATGVVQTEDQIFDSLADSDHHVTFCAFSAYIAELQPDLEESQHQLLWEQFDKAEDGRVSRDSFVRTLSADQEDEAENNVRRLEAQLMASAGLAFQAESHVRRLERKIKDLEGHDGNLLEGHEGQGQGQEPTPWQRPHIAQRENFRNTNDRRGARVEGQVWMAQATGAHPA